MFRQLRDCARARVTLSGAPSGARVVRTTVVWMDAQRVTDCCPDGAFLCGELAAMVCTPAGHGWSLGVRVAAEPCAWTAARRMASLNRLEIQAAGWTRSAVRTVLCKDALQMHAAADAGGDETVWQTCA